MSKKVFTFTKEYDSRHYGSGEKGISIEDCVVSGLEERCCAISKPGAPHFEGTFMHFSADEGVASMLKVRGYPICNAKTYTRVVEIESMPENRPLSSELSGYLNHLGFELKK